MTRFTGMAGVLLLAVATAACGGDDDSAPESSTSTAATEETTTSGPDELVLADEAVDGFARRGVTFSNLTYTITDAHVTNQDLRSYAEGTEAEAAEATHLILDVQVENATARQIESDADAVNLELAGAEIGVADDFLSDATGFIPANETVDGFLAFEIDPTDDPTDAELVLGTAPDRPARVPLTGPQAEPTLPMELSVTGTADGAGPTNGGVITFELLGATLYDDLPHGDTTSPTGERADEGEVFVQLHVRATKVDGRGDDLLTDAAFRLLVDGVPRGPFDSATAPEGSTPTPTASPGGAVDAWVLFAVDAGADSYVLTVGSADDDPGSITVEIPAV